MQAPKGGITIAGVFYKGGQFLPSDYEPKHGKYNKVKGAKAAPKPRKVEIAPYIWVECPEGKRSIYAQIAGIVAKWENHKTCDKLIYCGNETRNRAYGFTETSARELIEKWNNGERFI